MTHAQPPVPPAKLRVPRSAWLILVSGLLLGVWVGRYMWDFAAGYNGALLLRAGMSPYALQPLLNYPAGPIVFWVYPPLGLCLFLPFTLLSYPVAIKLWLGLELLGAALLAWIWARHFWKFDLLMHPAAMLIVCFGLNGTLLWLLTTGNAGLVEAVLLWLALAALLNGHDKRYGVLIAMASLLKVLPAFFM
ncbi:MAG: glycosyltransferase family 87 protein, partial [Chloroflexi bacterium]|nr:glycosyltransferase family 87 protein [Chloroflexota bacterium]